LQLLLPFRFAIPDRASFEDRPAFGITRSRDLKEPTAQTAEVG